MSSLTLTELEAGLRQARKPGAEFISNFFATPLQWPAWIRHGLVIVSAGEGFLWLARPENECNRLFYAGARTAVMRTIPQATERPPKPYVLDLIGRSAGLVDVAAQFSAHGFRPHLRLVRMTRAGQIQFGSDLMGLPGCGTAGTSDIPTILSLLTRDFDAFADQLPGSGEVQDAADAGAIRIIRLGDRLAGFLWFERTGVTASIRYWCSDVSARGLGIGGQLMRDYARQTKECARHLLWVRENNAAALGCYRHYGYSSDGLEDLIMILDQSFHGHNSQDSNEGPA